MDFDDTAEEAAWRGRVRRFLEESVDDVVRGRDRHTDAAGAAPRQRWQATLYDAGYVGITWPAEYGGQGGTPMQQVIVNQELSRAGSAPLVNGIGLGMCGPTILAHGTEEQKQRYLRPLLRGDEIWCQLFSEPAAGSDLAGLQTRAIRDGDGWRIRGQKVWTSAAQYSKFGLLIARTDPSLAKHAGLTMFLIDMEQPGVTVRPLRQMTGEAHFNEVFFDDALVPAENLCGEVDGGWRVAITTLMNERLAIGGGGADMGSSIETLTRFAARRLPDLPADQQALVREQLGRAVVLAMAQRYTGYRRLTALSQGRMPGPEASVGKLSLVALGQLSAEIGVRLLGDDAAFAADSSGDDRWQYSMTMFPGLAIAGGTNEILRNVVGERVLGLPGEPRPDKGVPAAAAGGVRA
ncbi:MAG TPA: acyl-CoA dehydrogenase family protein [Candidatus Dormibacteraeota bacterium]|jgi:alkylation response protein AidB-like acyl-CoA dehydrogenase|nr:acyl-CoA dehydrogenase family protein [Candidatus Dormibacteraeota bacterium]